MKSLIVSFLLFVPSLALAQTNVMRPPNGQLSGSETCQDVKGKICVDKANTTGWAGNDIGAWINSAIAALSLRKSPSTGEGMATITIATDQYTQTTTIRKPKWVILDFNNAVVVYKGSNAAIVTGTPSKELFGGEVKDYHWGGIRDLSLVGSGSGAGIWLGGDSTGAVSPKNLMDHTELFSGVNVTKFTCGFMVGQVSGQSTWIGGSIQLNETGICNQPGANSENFNMFGTQILNNSSMGMNLTMGGEFNFHSVSFDYNGCDAGKCGAVGNIIGGGPAGPMIASFLGCHFEAFNGILLKSPASAFQTYFNFSQSNIAQTASSGNDVAFIQVGGTNSQVFFGDGNHFNVAAGHTARELVDWQSLGTANVLVMRSTVVQQGVGGMVSIPVTNHSPNLQIAEIPMNQAGLYTGSAVYRFKAGTLNANNAVVGRTKQESPNQWAGVSTCANGTKVIVFPTSYTNPPAIIVFDETTAGGARLAGRSLSGFTVSCTGASDAFSWVAIGNPD